MDTGYYTITAGAKAECMDEGRQVNPTDIKQLFTKVQQQKQHLVHSFLHRASCTEFLLGLVSFSIQLSGLSLQAIFLACSFVFEILGLISSHAIININLFNFCCHERG